MSDRFGGIKRQVAYGLAAVSLVGAVTTLVHYTYFSASEKGAFDGPGMTMTRQPSLQAPKVALDAAMDPLFAREGKDDRADYLARQIADARKAVEPGETAEERAGGDAPVQPNDNVRFVAASLTPVDMARPGPTRAAAGLVQQSVNRGGKADMLGGAEMSVAKADGAGADEAEDGVSGTSAALFMLSSSAGSSAYDSIQEASASQAGLVTASVKQDPKATWDDLIELARVTGGDGEKIKPGIFGALSEKEFRAREFRCMATAIYFEARGESTKGQLAVGQVIMTRVRSDYYPNTICGVVYQGQWNRNACQFSFACDGKTDAPKNRKQWAASIDVAKKVISGQSYIKEVGDATHYHATYVSPKWRKMMKRVARVGVHIFYKADFVRPLVASNELDPS